MKLFVFKLGVLSLLLSFPQWVTAFGQNGHRIVAQIAANHLSIQAQHQLKKILGKKSLAQISTWPDEIRFNKSWEYSKPWHYISIDDNESFTNLQRSSAGDIVDALQRFEKTLKNPKAEKLKQWQALAFYVHLLGDIHQPLHVGRRDDRGGNTIKVAWLTQLTNLHSVWDDKLLGSRNLSFTEYSRFLDQANKPDIQNWQNSSYWDWAKESKALRTQVYDFSQSTIDKDGIPQLSNQYAFNNISLLEMRMLKAGIRLAGKLNQIFKK